MKKFLKRFEKLENSYVGLYISTKDDLKKSKRFERLEIHDKKIEVSITDKVAPEEKAPFNIKYYLFCPYCGKVNPSDSESCVSCKRTFKSDFISDYKDKEKVLKKCVCGAMNLKKRKNCWVCGRDFSLWGEEEVKEAPENVITLNIDGKIYKSTDNDLPPGIIALMERIRRQGYSEKLVNDWMQEKNEEIERQQYNLKSRLSEIRFGLSWRIIALIVFLIAIVFQFRACFSYNLHR